MGWTVTMDGRAMSVDLARVDDRWSMIVRRVETDASPRAGAADPAELRGDSHEIAIEPRGRGRHLVHVDGHVVPVTLLTPGRGASGSGAAAQATGPIEIVS